MVRRSKDFAASGHGVPAIDLVSGPAAVRLESGAIRALVPISNKSQFATLPEDVIERLDIVFYGDVDRAVLKTLEG